MAWQNGQEALEIALDCIFGPWGYFMPAGGKNAMARHFLLSYAILWVHPWLRLP
jgi:hypothetical protein